MKTRPRIGARVRLTRGGGLPPSAAGKVGKVVAHHSDGIAIIVRLDPQKPLRPYLDVARKFDKTAGVRFRRREGDWVIDYHDVRPAARPKAGKR